MAVTRAFVGVLLLLAVVAVTAWAREVPTDWVQHMRIEEERRMHPGVTRRTRDIKEQAPSDEEKTAKFWNDKAQGILNAHKLVEPRKKVAKNVILFLGDGMSIPTLTASRIYKGQSEQKGGEEAVLSFEKFPYTGLSKTYCVDTQVADSACTATAYLTGVKTNEGTIGVTAAVDKGNCKAMTDQNNHVDSILKWSQLQGKSTGIVTTTRVTHASPAGTYAHTAHRDWEADSHVVKDGQDPKVCKDIAYQLINDEPGKNINVILGGGRSEFRSSSVVDEEGERGYRLDRTDLIKQWLANHPDNAQYVWDLDGLNKVKEDKTDFLLGLFEGDHTRYNLDIDKNADPTLEKMTETAINVLKKNDKGYFLFVEGGRIDHAHHDTLAHKALDETMQLALAVEKAASITSEEDTLIIVTSDHAHTMSIAGYPDRNMNILGVPGMSTMDHKPYATLSYSNGPGFKADSDGSRHDLTSDNTMEEDYKFPAMVPLMSETHGGDDVAVFARGPYSHLFTGHYEQNAIPHIMAFASCVSQIQDGNAPECPPPAASPPRRAKQWRD